ncbi:glycosyltransferase family 1 protein [Brumicola pallidula]|uniref:Glycosyl transferase family 1 domain-containing protein n=1 Tax=Brumicola pallidula DSM 14239 = ACAM 615 TaxID=1121922 RepID=K6YAV6_9ALTE|nr:glycosyltransferase family 1 protein [Glaciecola pallidula]GAC29869.1 hypothetical protein GPAL_3018 [Glaciecola pallidula DSM 14239 = ACAM 615]
MRFSLVAVGANITAFPYLYKLSNILTELGSLEYVCWDRLEKNENLGDLSDIEYKRILKFSPEGKASLLFGYLAWFFKLLKFFIAHGDSRTIYFVSRLDAAAAIYLVKLFRPSLEYVYLDRDAYHMTYNLGIFKGIVKWFEYKIAKTSLSHFIPGSSRNFTKLENVSVIENTPNRNFFEQAKLKSACLRDDDRFTIYINGWLVKTRGANQILKAMEKLDVKKFRVLVAGPLQCDAISQLIKLEIVEYLGQLNNQDSLSYYFVSDVVLSFYDPSIEINRKAEPNKWFDCLFTETHFITNYGIETAERFANTGMCYQLDYGNSEQLVQLIYDLNVRKNETKAISYVNLIKELNVDFWDEKVRKIVQDILCAREM